jgi:hypothetical protein
MFPPEDFWLRFAERGQRKYPQAGDISCRSALTVHRGTAHGSPIARPVLVLGVDAPGAGHDKLHDLQVTRSYYDALPAVVRDQLVCRVVDALVSVTQKHSIEGLVLTFGLTCVSLDSLVGIQTFQRVARLEAGWGLSRRCRGFGAAGTAVRGPHMWEGRILHGASLP